MAESSERNARPAVPPDPLRPVPLGHATPRRIENTGEKATAPPAIVPRPITRAEANTPIPITPRPLPRPSPNPPQPTPLPVADDPASQRRKELASILWGEPGDTGPIADRVRIPMAVPPPAPASRQSPQPTLPPADGTDSPPRIHSRRQCSFPGLLRVLIPEQSFQPRVFAVRIVDLSPQGAQLETKQLTHDLARILGRERWFARLEALVPSREKMLISGRVAWADFRPELSFLGMQFDRLCNEVDDIFMADLKAETMTGALSLMPPIIDAFPTVTSSNVFAFTGRAPDAETVVVRNRQEEIHAPVIGGRFRVEILLTPDSSNFVSFTCEKGGVASIPTPVCILHKTGAADTISIKPKNLVEEFVVDPDGSRLFLRVSGPPVRFFQILRRLGEALEFAEEVNVSFELTGDANKAAQKLESLRPE